MRRLVIAILSTLILLSAPLSTPQGHGLYTVHPPTLTINLSQVGEPPAPAPAAARGAAQSAQESMTLEPGKPIERELSGGQSHSYKIMMASGQYLHMVVEQRGIDVAVALFAPDGKTIGEVNGEQTTLKFETISAIAEATGAYRVEVRSTEET